MNKRYQVFISSTYADLKEERQKVMQTLMQMDCIPAGMELFPAADQEQLDFIKKIIDDCDYYILIMGGRYGSVTASGVSYTEAEYDYAVSIGLKIVAFIHNDIDSIPMAKSEINADARRLLVNFRDKVSKGRLVQFWGKADELPGKVALSMISTIKSYPAVGWVRASEVSSSQILQEINELRKENEELKSRISSLDSNINVQIDGEICGLDDVYVIRGALTAHNRHAVDREENWSVNMTWSEIFAIIGVYLNESPNEDLVVSRFTGDVKKILNRECYAFSVDRQNFKTISIQLEAMGLVVIKYLQTTKGGMALFWQATNKGKNLTYQLRTIKK